jgi:dephospho-CoA kinase
MIVIVVGMPGSGKDVFVRMAMHLGFSKIGMGDVVREFASKQGLGSGDISIGNFASSQRREHGPAIWAERTVSRMPAGNVIIDGSRSLDEISYFKKMLGTRLRIVAIASSTETRYARLVTRKRNDDPSTREDFDRRDSRELSWGLGDAISHADITLENEGGLEVFESKCQAVLGDMLANASG